VDKDEYVRRSLSKIRHKPWELYVISRLIHGLDDPDIEFVPQQLIRLGDGRRALTDLYFPQFDLHLEVNEGYHLGHDQAEADAKRTSNIVFATDHEIHTIEVATRNIADGSIENIALSEVNIRVGQLVEDLQRRKQDAIDSGTFRPWDLEQRYNPNRYIAQGSISRFDIVAVRHQRDALRCFGYPFEGGHYYRGYWSVPGRDLLGVWFPRLYKHDSWDNELVDEGQRILERPLTDRGIQRMAELLIQEAEHANRVVFAKYKDPLGYDTYRYVGTFVIDLNYSTPQQVTFNLLRDVEVLQLPRANDQT